MMKIAVWHNLPSGGGKRACSTMFLALSPEDMRSRLAPPTAHREYLPFGRTVRQHIAHNGAARPHFN